MLTDYFLSKLEAFKMSVLGTLLHRHVLPNSCGSVLLSQSCKILFTGLVRTVVMFLVRIRVTDFTVSKFLFLLLHPADDSRYLHFIQNDQNTVFFWEWMEWTQRKNLPCPYGCVMYIYIHIYICVCVCVCVCKCICVYILLGQIQNVTYFTF
jgi:hypothetical protein